MEVTGIRKVCKSEPQSYAIAAILDDSDIPGWMKKPPPIAARPPTSSSGRTGGSSGSKVPGFRISDPVYAVWDEDGRWYPGRIKDDFGDRFEIEWMDKEAIPSVIKKSLVCRRTTFDDLRNRSSYLGALNLACRTGGTMKGLKLGDAGGVTGDDGTGGSDDQVETRRKAALIADSLFPPASGAATSSGKHDMTQDEWNTVLGAMKILNRFGVDGLISSGRSEVFHVPPKFPTPVLPPTSTAADEKKDESMVTGANWDVEASSLLHGWLTEGSSTTLTLPAPPIVASPLVTMGMMTAPSRAVLEASLSRSWGKPIALPRGPLDIFRPDGGATAVGGIKHE